MTHRISRTSAWNGLHPVLVTFVVALAGFVVVAGFALVLGAFVSRFVVRHELGGGDHDVARFLADHRTGTWNAVSEVGSYFAETVVVLVVLVIALVMLAVKRCWAQCGQLVVAVSVEAGVYLVATWLISRNRPPVRRLEDLIVADSFPSGHTAAAVALFGSLAVVVWSLTCNRVWRDFTVVLAVLGPIIVATSRVYRGMHNPTDAVSGALIGVGCVLVGWSAVRAGVREADRRRAASLAPPDIEPARVAAPIGGVAR